MVVGSGSFGRVFRVTHRLLGTEFVVKRSAHPFTTPSARRIWLQVRPQCRPLILSETWSTAQEQNGGTVYSTACWCFTS